MNSDWLILTLGDVCEKITDGAHKSPKSVDDGKSMASVKDLTRFGVDLSNTRKISKDDFDDLVKQGCKPQIGDVLIAKDGNSALDTVCTIDSDIDTVLLSSVAILRPDPEKLDSSFLKYYFCSPLIIDYLKTNFISGAAIPRVVLRDFRKAEINLPPLNVQRKISQCLSSIDNKIFSNTQTNQTLEQMAQAIFKSWFVDFDPVKAKMRGEQPEGMDEATASLFPEKLVESELGLIPEGWKVGTLKDIATFQNGYAFKGKDWTEEGFPVVKIGSVKPGIVDLKSCSYVAGQTVESLERFKLNIGDILVGMTGYVGETGLVPQSTVAPYLNQRVGRLTPLSQSRYELLYVIVRNTAYKQFAEAQAQGSAQANVSGKALMSYPIVIPSEKLIEKFSDLIAPMIKQKLTFSAQCEWLAQTRDTLLPKLLSGEIELDTTEELVEVN
ncbi:restriction endonuclease subunit S [Vibrio litoralis]|uniref:restriction endonuclease subunit S n=1 Tax=Vibrio litoralis TaxID=335972 RepID=UPI0018683081|nr:restriction endonuclease subunit S [Vibrio litoralis]